MPLRKRSILKEQRVFFVTTSTRNFEDFFSGDNLKSRLLEIIRNCVKKHDAKLYGYVIMPNHLHLLIRLEKGGPQLSCFMKDLKSITSRQLFPGSGGIWQERFDDLAIYTEAQFSIKLNYIHNNPVKARFCGSAEDYPFSSANSWINPGKDDFVTTDLHALSGVPTRHSAKIQQVSGEDT